MKVGVLTHYDVNNQGAQLQLFAMANFLEQNNINPIVLTYFKNYDFNLEAKRRNQISMRAIPYILKKYLFEKGIGLTIFNTKKYIINKRFRNKQYLFKNYAVNDCDVIVIGSDECYSLESGCNMMMYGHGCSTNKIIPYAPSFGQTGLEKIEQYNCKNLISSGLANLRFLSARDSHTLNLINALTDRKDISLVCDPALLFDFSLIKTNVKVPKKKYLLVYAYDKNFTDENEIKVIKEFAKKHNLKTVSAGTYHKWCDYNYNCNCLEWFEYFRKAEFIITDTFHGTIVSLISNKPIAIFIRKALNNNKLLGLIKQFGLEVANINEVSSIDLEKVYNSNINYNAFNEKLLEVRRESYDYLIGALNEYK